MLVELHIELQMQALIEIEIEIVYCTKRETKLIQNLDNNTEKLCKGSR